MRVVAVRVEDAPARLVPVVLVVVHIAAVRWQGNTGQRIVVRGHAIRRPCGYCTAAVAQGRKTQLVRVDAVMTQVVVIRSRDHASAARRREHGRRRHRCGGPTGETERGGAAALRLRCPGRCWHRHCRQTHCRMHLVKVAL
jgi:hypothetical protein